MNDDKSIHKVYPIFSSRRRRRRFIIESKRVTSSAMLTQYCTDNLGLEISLNYTVLERFVNN